MPEPLDLELIDLKHLSHEFSASSNLKLYSPYQSVHWLMNIGNNFKKNCQPILVKGYDDQGTRLLLPFLLTRSLGGTTCSWLASEANNVCAGIFDPAWVETANIEDMTALLARISKLCEGIDCFYLSKQPSHLGEIANPFAKFGLQEVHPDPLYCGELTSDFEAWYKDRLSASIRKPVRRRENSIQREIGDIELVEHTKPRKAEEVLKTFIDQRNIAKIERGIPNPFGRMISARSLALAIEESNGKQPNVRVLELVAGKQCLGVSIVLCLDEVVSSFAASMSLSLKRYGPGIMLQREVLRWAATNGFKKFDLGLGENQYKRAWAKPHHLSDNYYPITFRGQMICWNKIWLKRIVRYAKETPIIANAFGAIRATIYRFGKQ